MSSSNLSDPSVFLSSFVSAVCPDFTARLTFKSASHLAETFSATRENGPRSINAIRKFGRDVGGDIVMSLETDAGTLGFVMIFEANSDTSATVLAPSLTLENDDGRKALVYLGTGDKAAMGALRVDLEPTDGDRYTLGTDMPMPFGSWVLAVANEMQLENGERFTVYDYTAIGDAFFTGEDESGLSPEVTLDEGEESLRARIKHALDTYRKNPIQRHALQLAYQGFYPIPVAGIVTNPDTGASECSCQSYKRKLAKRDGLEVVEICGTPGKHPTMKNWPTRATRDPDKIMEFFSAEFNFKRTSTEKGMNIGIVTGPETGLMVLDVDGREGYAHLEKLEAEHGPLPASNRVITGSGGLHVYFRSPVGVTIKNSMSKIASKIDFRGVHGQVLAPPSKHKSGGNYQWEEGHSPDDLPIAAMPEWLIPLAIEGGEKQDAEEAAAKGSKGSKSTGKMQGSADRGKAHNASTNNQGWRGYLDEMGDQHGGRGFNGPIGEAMCSYFRKNGPDADATEFLEAYAAAFEKADKSKGGRDKYHPDHTYIAEQLENARKAIRDTPNRRGFWLDDDRNICVADGERWDIFVHDGMDWFHLGVKAKGGDSDDDYDDKIDWHPACAAMRVLHVAQDVKGGSKTIVIEFETTHGEVKQFSYSGKTAFDSAAMLGILGDIDFPMNPWQAPAVLKLFQSFTFPTDTWIVDETGWKDGGYLHFDGTYVAPPVADGEDTPKGLMLRSPPNVIGAAGTLEGWKDGIGRAFAAEYDHLETFDLGLFTGGAGLIASFIGTQETPEMNFGGVTRISKTTACMFGASVSGPPDKKKKGVLWKCNGTANAMERKAVLLSGTTFYADEAKLMPPHHFGEFLWRVSEGGEKERLGGKENLLRPTGNISGFMVTTVEIGAIAHAESKGEKQPDGLRSRLVDVSFDGITKLTGEAKEWIFGKVEHGEDGTERVLSPGARQIIEANYGHAWRPIVGYLQKIGAARAAGEVEHYANLIDPKAEGVQQSQAKIMALVWYSGEIMRKLGFLPSHVTDAGVERIIRWAWARRSEDSLLSPINKAMTTLRDNAMLMRGKEVVGVLEYEDRNSHERLGYIWEVDAGDLKAETSHSVYMVGQEWLCVPKKDGRLTKLCEATGNTGKTIVKKLEELGLLAYEGQKRKRPYFSRLPKSKTLPHYRINLAKLDEYVRSLEADADDPTTDGDRSEG